MYRIIHLSIVLLFLLFSLAGFTQKSATVYGVVKDDKLKPVDAATVALKGIPGGVLTDSLGRYSIQAPADTTLILVIKHLTFGQVEKKLTLQPGEKRKLDVSLRIKAQDIDIFILEDEPNRTTTMTPIEVDVVGSIPTPGGGIESLLTSQALGVSKNNELSSQYSVRGGNFDENLVYVNGIQVYRPFLIRSGQQEGLSFINSDMVASILFSAGGFEAKYGDKMSSVLDITYKEPKKFAGSITASLLGGAIHVEDASESRRFRHIHGLRYRTNQYVLNSLDTEGEYRPYFVDYQSYFNYDITTDLKIGFLGAFSRNQYQFVPETRSSDFGTVNEALRLTVFFDGQEIDRYETYFGALSTDWKPSYGTNLKFIASAFRTQESETFDIEGAYRLDELERDLSKPTLGDVAFNRGVGTFLNHARNYLNATVFSLEHKGTILQDENAWYWGLRYRHDLINDELNEWEMIDSVGFSVPYYPSDEIRLSEVIKSNNSIGSNRYMGYLQRKLSFTKDTTDFTITGGLRFNYWDFNEQLLWSPRVTAAMKPNWKHDFVFTAGWGYYHQPPFYREMRDLFGSVNPDIKAQTSIHYVLGSDFNFKSWGRPFKLATEIYYKQLQNIIPYEIDNVRIRYYAENNAKGYATGIDMKINGEFVDGIESWISLSVMQTQEDLLNDFYYDYLNEAGETIVFGVSEDQTPVDSIRQEPGFIPRPTDQRVNFSMFFQDYLPNNETVQMHLNLLWGSGLPFGPPTYERYKDVLRIPPYRRVDIGVSKQLLGEEKELPAKNPFHHFKSIWMGLEIFNLFQINNTISYIWVKDSRNIQYGVPNYLTARRVNLKLIMRF